MKFLEPLVRRSSTRFTLDDYAQWLLDSFQFGGFQYPVQTTQSGDASEAIAANFYGQVVGAWQTNGIVAAIELVRIAVFSQAKFQFRRVIGGQPGQLFGSPELSLLETPWPGGTTADLLSRMMAHADPGGNAYVGRLDGELVCMRPDWVDILLAPRMSRAGQVGMKRVGYLYFDGGLRHRKPSAAFLPHEVAHWAPIPDPLAEYRGMSWLTPVAREIMGDTAYTRHKAKFVDNAATPNLAVTLSKEVSPRQFAEFVELMDVEHRGIANAYKTLYLAGGADVTVVGANMQQLDFKSVQGAGETRIAAAAGVGAVMAQFSEGLAGSALNAGNYGAARRRFADVTMRHLWLTACGALSTLINVPSGCVLDVDDTRISFLQEDAADAAAILQAQMSTIESGVRAGFKPDSIVDAVVSSDFRRLQHTGLFSVQLQPPQTSAPATPPVLAKSAEHLDELLRAGYTIVTATEGDTDDRSS